MPLWAPLMCLVATWRCDNLNYAASVHIKYCIVSHLHHLSLLPVVDIFSFCVSLRHCSNPISNCQQNGQHLILMCINSTLLPSRLLICVICFIWLDHSGNKFQSWSKIFLKNSWGNRFKGSPNYMWLVTPSTLQSELWTWLESSQWSRWILRSWSIVKVPWNCWFKLVSCDLAQLSVTCASRLHADPWTSCTGSLISLPH